MWKYKVLKSVKICTWRKANGKWECISWITMTIIRDVSNTKLFIAYAYKEIKKIFTRTEPQGWTLTLHDGYEQPRR